MHAVTKRVLGWGAGVAIAAGGAMLAAFEGTKLEAYQDIAGVWSVCTGHAGRYAYPGARYTPEQCNEIFVQDAIKHYAEMRCITAEMPLHSTVALFSMFFNFGGRLCDSTLVRKINAGLPPSQYCPEILRWDKARVNGVLRPVTGLTRRRRQEHDLCLGFGRWFESQAIYKQLDFSNTRGGYRRRYLRG